MVTDGNPYQPPTAPLTKPQIADGPRRKRFRFRLVPATFCFIYGGVGLLSLLFLNVMIGVEIARSGADRVNFGPLVLIEAAAAAYCAVWLWAGRLWLQGKWLYAVITVLSIFLGGVAVDRAMKAGPHGGDASRWILNRIVRTE